MIDSARLISQLNITGLQNEDNPLYQLLRNLIRNQVALEQLIGSGGSGSGGGGGTTNLITQIIGLPGDDGSIGEDGAPGPAGARGADGITGAMGPMGAIIFPPDAEDGDVYPPIVGPQGNPGTTGAQGPLGVSLLLEGQDGEDGIMGPPGANGSSGSGLWTSLFKTIDESRNNNTVTADSTLQFPMLANKKYTVRLTVFCTGETASDFRFQITGPSTPTDIEIYRHSVAPNTTTGTFEVIEAYAGSPTTLACLTGQDAFIHIEATIQNGANAGTFSFDWAQNTTQAGENAIVYAGSWMEYRQLD